MSVPSSILNKLPKDVLIYMFETVQLKQKQENKILKDIIIASSREIGVDPKMCSFPDCDHFLCFGYDRRAVETCGGKGNKCDRCGNYWCVYHSADHSLSPRLYMLIHKNDKHFNCGPVCENCYDTYTHPDNFNFIEEFDKVPC